MFARSAPEHAPLPLQPSTRSLTDTRSPTAAPCAAAEGGSAEGKYEMGRMWFGARAGMRQDFKEAAKFWRLAAAQAWRLLTTSTAPTLNRPWAARQ